MRRLLAHFWSDERGLSAIEFALVATFILVPLLLGATELGRRSWTKTQFENAAQSGVDYAIYKKCSTPTTCAFTNSDIVNAVQMTATASSALGANVVAVAPPAACGGAYYCYGCPSASGVSLSATSTNCANGGTSGTYISLTATYNYTPLFHSCGDLLPSVICSSTAITWTYSPVSRVY
jgi:Flp pilus assembly protein TadG